MLLSDGARVGHQSRSLVMGRQLLLSSTFSVHEVAVRLYGSVGNGCFGREPAREAREAEEEPSKATKGSVSRLTDLLLDCISVRVIMTGRREKRREEGGGRKERKIW